MGPSNRQGAVRRSQRKAPRNVSVRQWPCGVKPRTRSPFGPHPRSGAMLVLIQVSSIKTRRRGSSLACHECQRWRLRAMSERARSRASSVFFEAQPFAAQKQPNCIVGDLNPARSEFILESVKRQMRRLADPFLDEGAMRLEDRLPMATHLTGRYRAGRSITLRPLHHRRHRHPKPQRHRAAALTLCNSRNSTLTQVIGNWSDHRMLASSPASILNHSSQIRNPFRFNKSVNRSSCQKLDRIGLIGREPFGCAPKQLHAIAAVAAGASRLKTARRDHGYRLSITPAVGSPCAVAGKPQVLYVPWWSVLPCSRNIYANVFKLRAPIALG